MTEVRKIAIEAYKEAKKVWGDDIPQRKSLLREKTAYEAYNDLSDDSDEQAELNRYLTSPTVKRRADNTAYSPLD